MANTTNLNLVKLSGSEKLKNYPTSQAGNMDIIDAALGDGFGANSKPSVNTSINNLADGLAIIANGNTHAAITNGQFVYVRNHESLAEGLYTATANISANGTLSGSNLTADSSGGLNTLNANINGIKNAKELGTASSLSTLQTLLANEAATMQTNGVEPIEVYCNPAFETFKNARYIGQLRTNYNNGTRIDFTVTLTSANGDAITIARINGTWNYIDLNSKFADRTRWFFTNTSSSGATKENAIHALCATIRSSMESGEVANYSYYDGSKFYTGTIVKVSSKAYRGRMYENDAATGFYISDNSDWSAATITTF